MRVSFAGLGRIYQAIMMCGVVSCMVCLEAMQLAAGEPAPSSCSPVASEPNTRCVGQLDRIDLPFRYYPQVTRWRSR